MRQTLLLSSPGSTETKRVDPRSAVDGTTVTSQKTPPFGGGDNVSRLTLGWVGVRYFTPTYHHYHRKCLSPRECIVCASLLVLTKTAASLPRGYTLYDQNRARVSLLVILSKTVALLPPYVCSSVRESGMCIAPGPREDGRIAVLVCSSSREPSMRIAHWVLRRRSLACKP